MHQHNKHAILLCILGLYMSRLLLEIRSTFGFVKIKYVIKRLIIYFYLKAKLRKKLTKHLIEMHQKRPHSACAFARILAV